MQEVCLVMFHVEIEVVIHNVDSSQIAIGKILKSYRTIHVRQTLAQIKKRY